MPKRLCSGHSCPQGDSLRSILRPKLRGLIHTAFVLYRPSFRIEQYDQIGLKKKKDIQIDDKLTINSID